MDDVDEVEFAEAVEQSLMAPMPISEDEGGVLEREFWQEQRKKTDEKTSLEGTCLMCNHETGFSLNEKFSVQVMSMPDSDLYTCFEVLTLFQLKTCSRAT